MIGLKTKITLALLLIAGVGGFGAYKYVQYQTNRIADLQTEVATLKIVSQSKTNAILEWQRLFGNTNRANDALSIRLEESREYRNYLINLFQKHDLTGLALAKPEMIEVRINAATKEAFDEIESITSRE